jgi:hypothetical protein
LQSLLEGNQPTNHPPLEVDPDPSTEKSSAAACTTKSDKSVNIFGQERAIEGQRERAKKASTIEKGVRNKRWKDRQDFEKFREYAIESARQNGKDDNWVQTVLNRTASCTDEESIDLICWKNWNLETPVVESTPIEKPVIPPSSVWTQERIDQIWAEKQAAKKQREKQEQEAKEKLLALWEAS